MVAVIFKKARCLFLINYRGKCPDLHDDQKIQNLESSGKRVINY